MKVVSIQRKSVLGPYYSPSNELVPEGVTVLAGMALTLLAPTIIYCAVVGRLWPLYIMGCNEGLGAALGLVMYKKSSDGFSACIPSARIPPASAGGLKKAA